MDSRGGAGAVAAGLRDAAGGDFIVQVRPGLQLQNCQLVQVRRSLLPEPQTLMQFECKTQAD